MPVNPPPHDGCSLASPSSKERQTRSEQDLTGALSGRMAARVRRCAERSAVRSSVLPVTSDPESVFTQGDCAALLTCSVLKRLRAHWGKKCEPVAPRFASGAVNRFACRAR
ncbi:hypothetical protein AAFF_G00056280 [Aldrovandia affinis]|uniref:Uncharacterized protein n=1 Tax=Aldrovandia affinis TaxID=143900 RepID=A0AAD7WFC5_9TELE|nr:hypothetical protein AAFF_G00056280 [Aldrovandia affinis]